MFLVVEVAQVAGWTSGPVIGQTRFRSHKQAVDWAYSQAAQREKSMFYVARR